MQATTHRDPSFQIIRARQIRADPRWPHLAALAVALGVPHEQAFMNADATLTMKSVLANLLGTPMGHPDDEQSAAERMLSELSRLFSNGRESDAIIGSIIADMMHNVTNKWLHEDLPDIIRSIAGSSVHQLFQQTLEGLQSQH